MWSFLFLIKIAHKMNQKRQSIVSGISGVVSSSIICYSRAWTCLEKLDNRQSTVSPTDIVTHSAQQHSDGSNSQQQTQ